MAEPVENKTMICPACTAPRTDYEPPDEYSSDNRNGSYLPACPSCGSDLSPARYIEEPGCWVDHMGRVRYAYPPVGRFAELWERITAITTEEERCLLAGLISNEIHENSTVIAVKDLLDEEWTEVAPNWDDPPPWLGGDR